MTKENCVGKIVTAGSSNMIEERTGIPSIYVATIVANVCESWRK